MALIAIGDIHGCLRTLEALLDELQPASRDHLLFIGDYVDRGPDAKGVIDRLLALRDEYTCTFLRGNHEALMLDYLESGHLALWQRNGGLDTIRSYRNGHASARARSFDLPDAHAAFLNQTKLHYETPDFFFVHGGLKPALTIEENLRRDDEQVFLWERGHLEAPELVWEKPVVCGHTPLTAPINRDRLIAIDTGCVYHNRPRLGRLTAVRLPERQFVTVPYAG